MPLATGRDLHIDTVLSNIVIGRRPQGYIADQLLPVLNVRKQSDIYYKRNWKENFQYVPNLTARAPGTKSKEVFWTVSSDTYFAKNYALSTHWTTEDEVNADDSIQLNQESSEYVTDRLLIDYEARVAGIANTAANVATTTNVATAWSNVTGSRPYDDLSNEIENFRVRTGYRPNVMVVPEQVATYLRRSDQIRDQLFGDRGGVASDEQVASLLKVQKILVPEIMVNTAGVGETLAGSGTLAPVWGNYVHLAYVSPLPGRKVDTWMQAFRWTDPRFGVPFAIRRFPFDSETLSQKIEGSYYQAEKVISTDLATRIASVI